jgi:hypothetical protein
MSRHRAHSGVTICPLATTSSNASYRDNKS